MAVDVTGRDPAHMPTELGALGGEFRAVDRADATALRAAVGEGTDLLVDCLCFTGADARSLLPLATHATSTVLISGRAVYIDAAGNHVNSSTPPRFSGPISETNPTMAPRDDIDYRSREGYGANKVAAELVALESGLPISVLRPSQIHGVGASPAREWAVVKRVLDGRTALLLARRGAGVVHTTAAANLAALIETVAERPGTRVLNCADPDAPSVREICRAIAGHLGHEWEEVVLLDDTAPAGLGTTPGTPRTRSSSTPPPLRHSVTGRPVPTRPRSRPYWTGWWKRPRAANDPSTTATSRSTSTTRPRMPSSQGADADARPGDSAAPLPVRGSPPRVTSRHVTSRH